MNWAITSLQEHFGYPAFRGSQAAIIERITAPEGGHALVLMPTGGGKSLCYQIPALEAEGGTIVISPLIALMQDQVQALQQRGLPAAYINSTVSRPDRERRVQQFVAGDIKLLYVTPERFRKPDFVAALQQARIDLFAIDEAHCISEWGHDFRPDYSRIAEFRSLVGSPRTIALTATATPDVQRDIIAQLGLSPEQVQIFNEGIERPNLRLAVHELVGDAQKIERMESCWQQYAGPSIVYFSLIQTLERFSQALRKRGLAHLQYHGKLSAGERKRAQNRFLSGEAPLVLATNAFGMGIDKADIRSVIHAEIPGSLESYYQEIGRAGRDDEASCCVLLYDEDDLTIQMDFVHWSNPDADFYRRLYQILRDHMPAVHSMGMEYLREQLHGKQKRDFRIETALSMMDRYGIVSGSVEDHNLALLGELPAPLLDAPRLASKKQGNHQQLLELVRYVHAPDCRRHVVASYFGADSATHCGNCDRCAP